MFSAKLFTTIALGFSTLAGVVQAAHFPIDSIDLSSRAVSTPSSVLNIVTQLQTTVNSTIPALTAADRAGADLTPYFEKIFTAYDSSTATIAKLTVDNSTALTSVHNQIIKVVSATDILLSQTVLSLVQQTDKTAILVTKLHEKKYLFFGPFRIVIYIIWWPIVVYIKCW